MDDTKTQIILTSIVLVLTIIEKILSIIEKIVSKPKGSPNRQPTKRKRRR